MDVMFGIVRLLIAVVLAIAAGKLISKLRLPAILGWLIAGMIMGPHAIGLLDDQLLDSTWFSTLESLLECTVGLMIGTELIWSQMKKAGSQILVTTITESLGTFLIVSLVFGVIFWLSDVPIYLAFMFGGIALATAPAPSLSVVNDLKTSGPVTKTLIPMAALDDLVGALVFFYCHSFCFCSYFICRNSNICSFILSFLTCIYRYDHRIYYWLDDASYKNFSRCA